MALSLDMFFLDPAFDGTLQAEIQQMVAQGILSGRFCAGDRLPSSRKLADHLGVSRLTVTLAYTELVASDFITSRGRSGYFVSENAPEPIPAPPHANGCSIDWDARLVAPPPPRQTPARPDNWACYKYPFIYGQADPTLFDHANWRQCALRALGQKHFHSLTNDSFDADDAVLVDFIRRQILPRRGINAYPDEILITMGAQNGLWLISQLFLGQGLRAVVENPGYYALRDILTTTQCDITAVDVDQDGLPPMALPQDTRAIFITPSQQCPTTATMPHNRRLDLLAQARDLDAIIIEDDYEFEMAFLATPPPALKSLDQDGRVLYVGSFSKSIFPGLRLGYIVGARQMIARARALRATALRHIPGHIQKTAAAFLSLGHYDALVRRNRQALAQRRATAEAAMAEFGLEIAGKGAFGGSSFWMKTPKGRNATDLARDVAAQSVLIEPGRPFFTSAPKDDRHYRLAYSSIPETRIRDGIRLIKDAGG